MEIAMIILIVLNAVATVFNYKCGNYRTLIFNSFATGFCTAAFLHVILN